MAGFAGKEIVVIIEFTNRRRIGVGGPAAFGANVCRQAIDHGAGQVRKGHGLAAGGDHRLAVYAGNGDGGIVDDAVDGHGRRLVVQRTVISGNFGDLPGELLRPC